MSPGLGEKTERKRVGGVTHLHRRARVQRRIAFLLVVLVAISTPASVPRPVWAASSPQNLPISIDETLFQSTVPSHAVLGHNYTVKLLVRNTSNESVPIVLRVNGPVDVIYTHPLLLQVVVGAGQQVLTNFSLIAFNRYSGLINVTAILWVWYFDRMPRPQIVQQVSALMNGVAPSPLYPFVLVLVGALPLAVVIVVFLRIRRNRRGTSDRYTV